jgi:uncharacterized membrane protein YphA (DoxX/SURF4 family)
MPAITVSSLLQLLIGLGLLNVWLLRSGSPTAFRGGNATSLREEFKAYGLPDAVFYMVGVLKVGASVALLAGLWVPQLVLPAAAVVALLMVGALAMHMRIGDPLVRSMPAATMLVLAGTLLYLA